MTQEERDIRRKLRVLEHGGSNGNVSKTCRYFGMNLPELAGDSFS